MPEPRPRREAIDRATEWLVANGTRYTAEALHHRLRESGDFTDAEIAAAEARAARALESADGPPPTDLRGRAGAIVVAAYVLVWAGLAWALVAGPASTSFGSIAAGILAVALAPIGLVSYFVIDANDGLRRGATTAFTLALAIPFVLLVGIAGTCVVTTGLVR